MDYTSKETSSNIKSIDKSVLEALKGNHFIKLILLELDLVLASISKIMK